MKISNKKSPKKSNFSDFFQPKLPVIIDLIGSFGVRKTHASIAAPFYCLLPTAYCLLPLFAQYRVGDGFCLGVDDVSFEVDAV